MNVKNLLAAALMAAPASALAANAIKVVPMNGGVKSPIVVPGQFIRINSLNTSLNAGVPFLTPTLKATTVKVQEAPAVGIVAAQQAFAVLGENPAMQVLSDKSQAAQGSYAATLNNVYEKSGAGAENSGVSIAGDMGSASNGLSKVTGSRQVAPRSSIANLALSADNAGGAGLGDGIRRLWNVTVGKFLRWVFGVEKKNAKALAANIISELDKQLPQMNEAAAEIGKTVHLLKIQLDKDTKESARLDSLINKAIELGKEAEAENLVSTKKAVDASLASTTEQYNQAKKNQEWALKQVKDFYFVRKAKLAQIQHLLTRDEMSSMQKRMNELNGKFKIGDVGAQMDKLEQIVNENEAEAKGQQDVIDSSGESTMKEIEDAVANSDIKDEIARRKAELEKKKNGGQ